MTVMEQPGSEIEFKPRIESQQLLIQKRLLNFGEAAVEKLRLEVVALRGENLENVDILPSPQILTSKRHKKSDSITHSPRFSEEEQAAMMATAIPVEESPKVAEVKPQEMNGSGMTNEQLAHELVMNPEFELKPVERSPMEERIRAIAKKAMFDGMREEFAKGNFASYVPGMMTEMKEVCCPKLLLVCAFANLIS